MYFFSKITYKVKLNVWRNIVGVHQSLHKYAYGLPWQITHMLVSFRPMTGNKLLKQLALFSYQPHFHKSLNKFITFYLTKVKKKI
jgi:hypothetical protein